MLLLVYCTTQRASIKEEARSSNAGFEVSRCRVIPLVRADFALASVAVNDNAFATRHTVLVV